MSPREKLVETAAALFYRYGCHAVGIDTVLAEAGVAKMTLYRHFRSKDELVLAALRRMDERFRNAFMAAVERASDTPAGRLDALFDVVRDWVRGKDFYGCPFINVTAEFAAHDDPVHVAAAEHKRLALEYIERLAAEAGAADARGLARALKVLLEGCTVLAQVTGQPGFVDDAQQAARLVLREGLRGAVPARAPRRLRRARA
ncbi:TetR/AcrR family transcriptional regulator [Anaeromyxobacter dehalogenans]|uniref:Transcriptional regulator, TetR family n=1 Tax=Anaeromyxobacter dehalogenans (strain 2CP-C) TaxID=290397 RepID=Q2IMH7_ANADE|nr:TetR/AcrR family transcriptional regulator [Anaeromyxobacter dehalogenans]ABC80005.1 transcriptional regulator, TetR family [Anaeromyxobacter dehalogenans 2CP-C]